MAATVIAVIQSTPIFKLDAYQRAQTHRHSTAWIKHFAEYLDGDVLPQLPGPFGAEYINGDEKEQTGGGDRSVRVNHQMLYDLADHLRLLEGDHHPQEPVHVNPIVIPSPLVPPVSCCPGCGCCLYCPRSGHTYDAWVYNLDKASRVPVYLAECRNPECLAYIHPDRFTHDIAGGGSNDVYFRDPQVLEIGRGKFASRALGLALSNFVVTGHLPLSTFADCWNIGHSPRGPEGQIIPQSQLQHTSLWRLFLLHHSLLYIPRTGEFVVNAVPSEEEDNDPDATQAHNPLVRAALALFPSVPSGKYQTYHIPGTENHSCAGCTHFHRTFPPGMGVSGCSDNELLEAHRAVITDESHIVTADVIDGIEKIGHKVSDDLLECASLANLMNSHTPDLFCRRVWRTSAQLSRQKILPYPHSI